MLLTTSEGCDRGDQFAPVERLFQAVQPVIRIDVAAVQMFVPSCDENHRHIWIFPHDELFQLHSSSAEEKTSGV